MPVMGVEPIRCHHQRILSPSRLPIPTHRRVFSFYIIPAPGQIVKCSGGIADKTLHFLAATPHFAMGITVLMQAPAEAVDLTAS